MQNLGTLGGNSGGMQDLGTLGWRHSIARAINDNGDAVGYLVNSDQAGGGPLRCRNIQLGKVGTSGAGVLGICAGPFALVLGILPGMLLGAVSGLVIGLLAHRFTAA